MKWKLGSVGYCQNFGPLVIDDIMAPNFQVYQAGTVILGTAPLQFGLQDLGIRFRVQGLGRAWIPKPQTL